MVQEISEITRQILEDPTVRKDPYAHYRLGVRLLNNFVKNLYEEGLLPRYTDPVTPPPFTTYKDFLEYKYPDIKYEIDALDLSVRAHNSLEREQRGHFVLPEDIDPTVIATLNALPDDVLTMIRNFGKISLGEVREKINEFMFKVDEYHKRSQTD